MGLAPWDAVTPQEQHFVLFTGANSGVGLSIGHRLIDDFFAKQPPSHHLVLLPTTRSPAKARQTVDSLRSHLEHASRTSPALARRRGKQYDPRAEAARVHVLSVRLDLCDLPDVYLAADKLVRGTTSNPPLKDGRPDPLTGLRVPRLDAVILNAGFGSWLGLDWVKMARQLFNEGLLEVTTRPLFKVARAGVVLAQVPRGSDLVSILPDSDPEPDHHPTSKRPRRHTRGSSASSIPSSPLAQGSAYDTKPTKQVLGEVFCANVFGHYVLAHELLPLLSRRADDNVPPGRIIWTSSVSATGNDLSLDDIQGVKSADPYEVSKRLTDVLSLSCGLPAAKRYSDTWLRIDDPEQRKKLPVPPRVYLTHPGVVHSALFPLNIVLYYLYWIALTLSRYVGSAWHGVSAYRGASAPAWLALENQDALDEMRAERVKWGSATDMWLNSGPKATEVDGWGWEGEVEEKDSVVDKAKLLMRGKGGRKFNALDVTTEDLQEFEATGAECWKEMEALRQEWEDLLGVGEMKEDAARNAQT